MSIEASKRAEVVVPARKKLLVFNASGFLLDSYRRGKPRPGRPWDGIVLYNFFVYDRPFCHEFLEFCFENFVVGVWSSHQRHNVDAFVQYIFKENKQKLAFVWHQEHCTDTGFRHPDNGDKPVFLKELRKLWRKEEPGLPWKAGDYGPSNTLLIDDSPSKAMKNPPHTAIFPKTYDAADREDNFLGKELRTYLRGLMEAADVQAYVLENPIGEPSIGMGDPRWSRIFRSLNPEDGNGRGRFVVADVLRTGQYILQSGSAKGIQRTPDKRFEEVLGLRGSGDEEPEKNVTGEEEKSSLNGNLGSVVGSKDEKVAKKLVGEDESKSNSKALGSLGNKDAEPEKKPAVGDEYEANGKALRSLGNKDEEIANKLSGEDENSLDSMLRKLRLKDGNDAGEDVPAQQ